MTRRKLMSLAAAMFLAVLSSETIAEESNAGSFLYLYEKTNNQKAKDLLLVHLYGIYNGFMWMNAAYVDKGYPPSYCQPSNLAQTAEQTFSIFEKYVNKNPHVRKFDVAGVLLVAMQWTYPCKP